MNVLLADGSRADLEGYDLGALGRLQYEQECAFAERILRSPKGTRERMQAVAQGYDTVCAILARQQPDHAALHMGLDRRYVRLVPRWVMACHAFIVNSKSGGAAARHRRSVSSAGGS